MKKKTLAVLLSCAMLMGAAVGGAIAWLTDTTEEVVNTFTVGKIEIVLEETDENVGVDDGANDNKNHYDFVPGDVLQKDPKVTVLKDSVKSYLFIKIIEENNVFGIDGKKIVDWSVRNVAGSDTDDRWVQYKEPSTEGNKTTYYYYRIVEKVEDTNGTSFYILEDKDSTDGKYENGSVKISSEITKDLVSLINENQPKLSFWAAAVQYDNINAAEGKTAVDVAFEQIEWPSETTENGN